MLCNWAQMMLSPLSDLWITPCPWQVCEAFEAVTFCCPWMTPNLANINRKLDFEKRNAYYASLLIAHHVYLDARGWVSVCVIHAELCLWAEIDHVCLSFNGGRQNPGSSSLRSEKDVSGTDMFKPPPQMTHNPNSSWNTEKSPGAVVLCQCVTSGLRAQRLWPEALSFNKLMF